MTERVRTVVSVIVPSYRRPERLEECLAGIAASDSLADEVLVVLRRGDERSARVVALSGGKIVWVEQPGVLAAMRAGVRESVGQIVVFFDDDAVPARDWLTRILGHLSEPAVGAAGGRDIVTRADVPPADIAGVVSRWGKLVGNHHRVSGLPRSVDVLKGANMAFKREALALPVGLRGRGAETHHEVAACLWAQSRGWTIVLDPLARVMHLPGPRFDADQRQNPALSATFDAAYNLTLVLLVHRRGLVRRRLLFGMLIGDRGTPGLARAFWALVKRDRVTAVRVAPSLAGQAAGAFAALRGMRMDHFERG